MILRSFLLAAAIALIAPPAAGASLKHNARLTADWLEGVWAEGGVEYEYHLDPPVDEKPKRGLPKCRRQSKGIFDCTLVLRLFRDGVRVGTAQQDHRLTAQPGMVPPSFEIGEAFNKALVI